MDDVGRNTVAMVEEYLATTFPKLERALLSFKVVLNGEPNYSSVECRYELIYEMLHPEKDAQEMIDTCENANEREEIRRFLESQPQLRVVATDGDVLTTDWIGIHFL